MIDLGKIIHRFEKSRTDDFAFAVSEYMGRPYINLAAIKARPDSPEETGGLRAFITIGFHLLPDFLEGVERLKEVGELIKKGGHL